MEQGFFRMTAVAVEPGVEAGAMGAGAGAVDEAAAGVEVLDQGLAGLVDPETDGLGRRLQHFGGLGVGKAVDLDQQQGGGLVGQQGAAHAGETEVDVFLDLVSGVDPGVVEPVETVALPGLIA